MTEQVEQKLSERRNETADCYQERFGLTAKELSDSELFAVLSRVKEALPDEAMSLANHISARFRQLKRLRDEVERLSREYSEAHEIGQALRTELERVRQLLRPHCKHENLYDGVFCLDCGIDLVSGGSETTASATANERLQSAVANERIQTLIRKVQA